MLYHITYETKHGKGITDVYANDYADAIKQFKNMVIQQGHLPWEYTIWDVETHEDMVNRTIRSAYGLEA